MWNCRECSVCCFDSQFLFPDLVHVTSVSELGEGPYVLLNAAFNDTVIGANLTSGEVFSLPKLSAQHGVLFNFMVTVGLYKDKLSRECIAATPAIMMTVYVHSYSFGK